MKTSLVGRWRIVKVALLHHLLTARLRLPESLNAKPSIRQDAEEITA